MTESYFQISSWKGPLEGVFIKTGAAISPWSSTAKNGGLLRERRPTSTLNLYWESQNHHPSLFLPYLEKKKNNQAVI